MTNTDTSTDPLLGYDLSDIVVGHAGQTLADAASAERTHAITIPTTIDGRPAHASVAAMLDAIATAASSILGPFVVQFDDGEFIVAVDRRRGSRRVHRHRRPVAARPRDHRGRGAAADVGESEHARGAAACNS